MVASQGDGEIRASGPDPVKTAVELILKDLLELQDRLQRQERRGAVRPEEPARTEENATTGRGTSAPDSSTSTDTEKLIAYVIQKLRDMLSPPARQQPGQQQAPAQAPDRFEELYTDQNRGKAATVAQAVEAILAEHPALVEMYHNGQLPRTQRLVEHAAHAPSERTQISAAAALTSSPPVSAVGPQLGGEDAQADPDAGLSYLAVDDMLDDYYDTTPDTPINPASDTQHSQVVRAAALRAPGSPGSPPATPAVHTPPVAVAPTRPSSATPGR
ncbi:hypothetical protein ACTU45_13095 [Streptomyces sp. 24-1644]|uniref:hypothetical protein n=1 Tax=Streptomyces sp. 24-1644 TaxID=3457315 RepID=UPI003FA6A189